MDYEDDVFSIVEDYVPPAEAFEQLELIASYFVNADKPVETIIISVRYEELMLKLEKLLGEEDWITRSYNAGFIDFEEARIEVLDLVYEVKDVIKELKLVNALKEKLQIRYIEVFSEYLRVLGRIAFEELVKQHQELIREFKEKEEETTRKHIPFTMEDEQATFENLMSEEGGN